MIILNIGMFAGMSQAQSIATLSSDYKAYSKKHPWEKVYLHTDKAHYFFNDTIWIKAYAFIENGYDPVENSPTVPLYVDLVHNEYGAQVEHIIIRLTEGRGQADLVLPTDLRAGIYTLRAYSNWMRNFGQEAFFHQKIWIGDFGDIPAVDNTATSVLKLDFFPEGGEMVAGLPSRVGFKGSDGSEDTNLSGYLLNTSNDTLLSFSSEHMGMGSFKFIPKSGEEYKVIARSVETDWVTFPFPEAKAEGYILVMDTNPGEDEVLVNIHSGRQDPNNPLHLIGLYKGKVIFEKSLGSGENELRLSKDDFHPGIVQFTLLDNEGDPLSERLVYFHPFAQGVADFNMDKEEYGIQETVRLEIAVTDEYGSPVEGEFSLAVTDAQQVFQEGRMDIISYLELSSELKGEIEQPAYYFDPENLEAERHLDNLLLTQGWRKFSWEKFSTSAAEPEFVFEQNLSLSGQVNRHNQKPIVESELLTVVINSGREMPQVFEGATDERGRFVFMGLDYQDSVGIFIQAYTEKEKRSGEIKHLKRNDVKLESFQVPEFKRIPGEIPNDLRKFRDYNEYLVEVLQARDYAARFRLNQEIELGEVIIRGRRSDQIPDKRSQLYGDNPDFRLEVTSDFYTYSNVFHVLRGRAAGVNVVGDVFDYSTPPQIHIRGGLVTGNASGIEGGARIFIDGNPAHPSTAMALMVIDIEKIDILKSFAKGVVYGSGGIGGVVNILTKSGNPNKPYKEEPIFGNATIKTKGYAPVRKFYVPNTHTDTPKVSFDYRSTIYWEPVVQTDANGKAYVEFPLTEGKTTVEMDLQGISKNGEPIRGNYRFEVK